VTYISEIRYLGNKGARARILLGFFIPHCGLSIAKRWGLKGLDTWVCSLVSSVQYYLNLDLSV